MSHELNNAQRGFRFLLFRNLWKIQGGGGILLCSTDQWVVGFTAYLLQRDSPAISLSPLLTHHLLPLPLTPTTASMLYCFIHFLRILLCYPPPPLLQHSSQDQWLIWRYLPITDCNQPLEADFLGFPFIFLLIHSLFTLRCSITTFGVCVWVQMRAAQIEVYACVKRVQGGWHSSVFI